MKFRTEIKCIPGPVKIDHQSNVVLLGSCFSEHMVEKFNYFKFNTYANPFGILFHPRAIETAIQKCVNQTFYDQNDLLQYGDTWISLDHHSSFDQKDPQLVLQGINNEIETGYQALKKASHVIITLGTSWVYKWKKDGRIVGNCHKIPQKYFTKEILTSREIQISLRQIITYVRSINKKASFIFTISPVRHLKDGFAENTLSKALLHAAIQAIKEDDLAAYFPAFEIMMDDLRDYRFYKSDLVHPNEMAVDYIWELFKNSWISEDSIKTMVQIEDIQKSLSHKPFDPESEAHKKFLRSLELKIEHLQTRYPQINFKKKGSD